MFQIAYIAKLNQTNSLILDTLNTHFDAHVVFIEHEQVLDYDDHQKVNPDLVIFDLNTSVKLGNAPDKIEVINQHFSKPPLIVIHPYSNKKFIQPILDAGANGILPIAPSEDELKDAVRETLAGKTYVSFA